MLDGKGLTLELTGPPKAVRLRHVRLTDVLCVETKMICDTCKHLAADIDEWPCKYCTPDDRRYEERKDMDQHDPLPFFDANTDRSKYPNRPQSVTNPKNEPTGPYTGRCGRCGSDDLWDDCTAYGCNNCGAVYSN